MAVVVSHNPQVGNAYGSFWTSTNITVTNPRVADDIGLGEVGVNVDNAPTLNTDGTKSRSQLRHPAKVGGGAYIQSNNTLATYILRWGFSSNTAVPASRWINMFALTSFTTLPGTGPIGVFLDDGAGGPGGSMRVLMHRANQWSSGWSPSVGKLQELKMVVFHALGSSGSIRVYWRLKGSTTWIQVMNIPSVETFGTSNTQTGYGIYSDSAATAKISMTKFVIATGANAETEAETEFARITGGTATTPPTTGGGTTTPPPATGPATVPGVPTLNTPTAGDRSVALTWTARPAAEQVDSYQVYIFQGGTEQFALETANGVGSASRSVTGLSKTITGLTNGTAYEFRLSAHNALGNGAWGPVPGLNATPSGATAAAPLLTATPESLAFSAAIGGGNPASQTIDVANVGGLGGGGSTAFTVTDDVAWLSVAPTSDSAPSQLTVTATNTGSGSSTPPAIRTQGAAITGTGTSQVVPMPTGTVSGDVVELAFTLGVAGTDLATTGNDITAANGWTIKTNRPAGGPSSFDGYVALKHYTTTPPSSLTVGFTASTDFALVPTTWNGTTIDQADPWIAPLANHSAPNQVQSLTTPTLTTDRDNSRVIARFTGDPDTAVRTWTADVGTERFDVSQSTTFVTVAGYDIVKTTTGAQTFTSTISGAPQQQGSIIYALRPAFAAATGNYTGSITIDPSEPTAPNIVVPVTLNISGASFDATPAEVTFSGSAGGTNPAAQTVSVTTDITTGDRSFSVTDDMTWLTVSPTSGTVTTPVTLTLTPSITGMQAGTYSGTVLVTPTDVSAAGVGIPVTMTLSGPPNLTAAPESLAFNATQGGTNPPSQTIGVSNVGGAGNVTFTVTDDMSWLAVTPASGSAPATLTATATTGSLAPGTYSGTVTIDPGEVTDTNILVPVTFVVSAAATSGMALTLDPTSESTTNAPIDLMGTTTYKVRPDGMSFPAPPSRAAMISNVDGEGDELAWQSFGNRSVDLALDVLHPTNVDIPLGTLAAKVAKLRSRKGTIRRALKDGSIRTYDIENVTTYEPTTDITYDVGNVSQGVRVGLECKPFARGVEVLHTTATETTAPALIFNVTNVPGDVPALARLAVQPAQAMRKMYWGIQHEGYSAAADQALLIDSSSFSVNASATNTTPTDATRNGGSYRSAVIGGTESRMLWRYQGKHRGAFRVLASMKINAEVRLWTQWAAQTNGPTLTNDYVDSATFAGSNWNAADLGIVYPQPSTNGTWTLEIWGRRVNVDVTPSLDYVILLPVAEGSGEFVFAPFEATTWTEIRSDSQQVNAGPTYAPSLGSSGFASDSYVGDYLLVQPSGPEGRTSRIVVKFTEGQTPSDTNFADITARLYLTPRYL